MLSRFFSQVYLTTCALSFLSLSLTYAHFLFPPFIYTSFIYCFSLVVVMDFKGTKQGVSHNV